MKNGFVRLAALVSSLFLSITVPAQDLPVLPADASIRHAVLPNGLNCYVTGNPAVKGFADYALVSKENGATLMYFRDKQTADEKQVDSTLVALMKHVEELGRPSVYALMASGDLKADDIMKKLRYMSYMIPAGEPAGKTEYAKGELTPVAFKAIDDTLKRITTIYAEWTSPRTPEHLMNTVQTAVYDKTVYEFGEVACSRIRAELAAADVPVADVRFAHRGSLEGRGDERFRITVAVETSAADHAEETIREVLAEIDAEGASAAELKLAENRYFASLERRMKGSDRTNEGYINRCIAAYLYNGSLSSVKDRLAFHKSKYIPDQAREALFAGVASALIDIDAKTAEGEKKYVDLSDTLSFPGSGPKVKVTSDRKDPISGGRIWTFSNGFKVVYRKMPTGGVMHYSLAMNGGYGSIRTLFKGEGAFMSDYLDICHISGLKGRDFKDMLCLSGITMDEQVNLSNVIISGEAADANLPLLLKSLLAVANDRSVDTAAVSYYQRSERLRLERASGSVRDMGAVIDSLICPDYIYSPYKSAGHLQDDTFDKAAELFDEMSSKMNDGVLVLVGDMDETKVRKTLLQYVGGFRTREGVFGRTMVHYQPVSGWMTYNVEGNRDAVVVAMSARLPMTADNYLAADIAAMYLKEVMQNELAPLGLKVNMSQSRRIYPEDRFSVMLLVEGEDMPEDIMRLIRTALAKAEAEKPDKAYMEAAKAYCKNLYDMDMKGPSYWLHAVAMRYLDGKDFTTGYASKIDAVTPAKVCDILTLLGDGSKVEYKIDKR